MKTKNRTHSARRTTNHPSVELMETRQMLSGYGFSSVLAVQDRGSPTSAVIVDSSGNLFGTTARGGVNATGTVYEIAKGSGKTTTLASFPTSLTGGGGQLTLDSSGNLYGSSVSSIFEVAKGSGKVSVLTNLPSGYDGFEVYPGNLTLDSHGDLFGTTTNGGPTGGASIFELAKGSSTVSTVANFSYGGMELSPSSLAIDSSGNLYGTNDIDFQAAGPNLSSVFEVVKGSGTISTLALFPNSAVLSTPIIDANGNVYASANPGYYTDGHGGGNSSVFEVVKGSGKITTLATFNSEVGVSTLVRDSAGNLYGTADPQDDGGAESAVVFKVAPGSNKVTTLTTVAGRPSSLAIDSTGNLYGTATVGVNMVFEVAAGSSKVTPLVTFGELSNAADLTMDSSGNIYGIVGEIGTENDAIFEVAVGTTAMTTLATFNAVYTVPSGLTVDSTGDVFGTLGEQQGGVPENATVFEVVKGSGKLTTRATLGAGQISNLVSDSKGNLYGTFTPDSGADATVFEVAKSATKATTLATFAANVDPTSITIDSTGDLFGSTEIGYSQASVFELAAGATKLKTLVTLNTDGMLSALTLDAGGNLYGTLNNQSPEVNAPNSTVFEIVKGSGKLTTLATFSDYGDAPSAVVVDSLGNLFGTEQVTDGSEPNVGSVFEVAKGSGKVTNVLTFNSTTGTQPGGPLILGPGNTLFGATEIGGPQGGGVVFKLSPQ